MFIQVAESGENVSALALFEDAETKAAEEEVAEQSQITLVFVMFCLLEVTANFDAGVLPACVGELMTQFDLDYGAAGFLGALVSTYNSIHPFQRLIDPSSQASSAVAPVMARSSLRD